MKKLTGLLLGIASAACFTAAPMCLSSSEASAATAENIAFNNNDLYVVENVVDEMPKTFEATLQIDETYSSAGGVIFSNIDANVHVAGSYTSLSTNAISFEISTKGWPKLYHKDDKGNTCTVVFDMVDVRSADFVHLAIKRDGDTAYCYLNGELRDQRKFEINDFVSAYSFAVGGDYQEKRANYFKGQLQSVAIYSDARTDAEILADKTAVNVEDENLMFAYDLTGKNGADVIEDLSKNDNDLKRTWLFSDTIEEDEYDYAMMVLGDTQALNYYRQNQAGLTSYDKLFDYIVANAKQQKVMHINTLGDLDQGATTSSAAEDYTNNIKPNYAKLDKLYQDTGIGYSVVAGNHDYVSGSWANWKGVFGGSTKGYAKQYFASSDPETALVTAHKFSMGDLDYLLVAIGWRATAKDIAWADEIIAAHPNHNVIITTHGYKNQKGNLTSLTSYEPIEYNWVNGIDSIVKKHKNVVLTLSGHHPTTAIENFVSYGDNGNKIINLVIDPTYFDGEHKTTTAPFFSEGAGMIAYLRFSEDGKKVGLSWYSAIKQKYYNSNSVYSIEIPTIERKQLNVQVNGYGGQASEEKLTILGNSTENVDITFTPDAGYHLSKLTLDGVNVMDKVTNNVYSMSIEAQRTGNLLLAEFAKNAACTLSVENTAAQGEVLRLTDATEFSVGEKVDFEVTAKSGWKIASVKLNGAILEKNENGTYTATLADGNNVFAVSYIDVNSPIPDTETPDSSGTGNSDSDDLVEEPGVNDLPFGCISATSVYGLSVGLAALAVGMLIKKRKA